MKLEDLDKIDSSGMYRFYDDWPKIARESYDSVDNKLIIEKTLLELGTNKKKLKGDFKGYYRYRIGNYRLFYLIEKKKKLVIR